MDVKKILTRHQIQQAKDVRQAILEGRQHEVLSLTKRSILLSLIDAAKLYGKPIAVAESVSVEVAVAPGGALVPSIRALSEEGKAFLRWVGEQSK